MRSGRYHAVLHKYIYILIVHTYVSQCERGIGLVHLCVLVVECLTRSIDHYLKSFRKFSKFDA